MITGTQEYRFSMSSQLNEYIQKKSKILRFKVVDGSTWECTREPCVKNFPLLTYPFPKESSCDGGSVDLENKQPLSKYVIRFSVNPPLVQKIANKIGIDKIFISEIPIKLENQKMPLFLDIGYAKVFLESIVDLQQSHYDIVLTRGCMNKNLKNLVRKGTITERVAESFRKRLSTILSISDFKELAGDTRDPNKAVSLAYFYRNQGVDYSRESLIWLCKAQSYLGAGDLGGVPDVKDYFRGLCDIATSFPFQPKYKAVANILADSPIKRISFYRGATITEDEARGIGLFLERSISIEEADFDNTIGCDILAPIAESLKVNRSLRDLDFCESRIRDKGVEMVISAIEENPNSKIAKLNFAVCDLTDSSVTRLLNFAKARPGISWISVAGNPRVSSCLEGELDQLCIERQKGKDSAYAGS